jgi:hypothetical protein
VAKSPGQRRRRPRVDVAQPVRQVRQIRPVGPSVEERIAAARAMEPVDGKDLGAEFDSYPLEDLEPWRPE